MSKLTIITDRAMDLFNQAGTNLRQAMPDTDRLLQTGAALGAIKAGSKVAGGFVRRNPAVVAAAAVGVGVLAYLAYRKRKQQGLDAPIDGKSRRIEARRVSGNGAASKRAPRSTRKSESPSAEA